MQSISAQLKPLPQWPVFAEEEIDAARKVLQSGHVNYWTGSHGKEFEELFAKFCDCKYGVALCNGSVGLEIALRSLGIGDNDEVLVTPRTFVASASAIVTVGAMPVFCDVDLQSQNIDPIEIEKRITSRTKAIIAVHLAGWPCDMVSIIDIAMQNGLATIEDCAQAHGATLNGQVVGSFGECGVFSFCQDKIMSTAGEGGMIVTNSKNRQISAWAYKDHGKSIQKVYSETEGFGFRWVHDSFGSNYRMTEIQSAIGRLQLRKLPNWLRTRRFNAGILTERFSELPLLRVTRVGAEIGHAYYKYYVFVRPERLAHGWSRDRILEEINLEGVPCFTGSCPEVYREKAFVDAGFVPEARLPVAKELGETSLMFQVHPTLGPEHMNLMADVVKDVASRATR